VCQQGRPACALSGKEACRREELCAVLRASCDCALRFEDFLTTFDDEETPVESITPLQVAELKPGDCLLIVTCNYQVADKTKRNDDLEDCCVLATDSVGFQLIVALSE
jgi:hypothetical protein